jgi:uncharacterized Zn-binding protein involved in type VI secretion
MIQRRCQRRGDSNDAGGIITKIPQNSTFSQDEPVYTVFCNGEPISVDGSIGTGHPLGLPHAAGVWTTANGSDNVLIGGRRVNREGDPDSCGHVRIGGSPNVFINQN